VRLVERHLRYVFAAPVFASQSIADGAILDMHFVSIVGLDYANLHSAASSPPAIEIIQSHAPQCTKIATDLENRPQKVRIPPQTPKHLPRQEYRLTGLVLGLHDRAIMVASARDDIIGHALFEMRHATFRTIPSTVSQAFAAQQR
jgi:hypothetical protein